MTRPDTVLAIDDDPMALELIEAVLGPEGYRVRLVRTALARRHIGSHLKSWRD
jgi:CheY-like chemotaxis protein